MWTTAGRCAARLVVPLIALGLVAAPSTAWAATKPAPSPSSAPTAAATGAASGPVTFGIAPASADRPDDRAFLQIGAAPGSVVFEHVAVLNQSDAPLELDVYAVDAGNTEDGSLGFAARGTTAGAGSWARLGVSHVTVPAQSQARGIGSVIVPITVSVPADAEPGDHVIGVVASLTTVGRATSDAPAVRLEQRAGARVYVDVKGPLAPSLHVKDLHATYDRGPLWGLLGRGTVHVTWTDTNDGNVRYAVQSGVGLRGPFGVGATGQPASGVVELVPGGRAKQTLDLHGWPWVRTAVTVTATAVTAPGGTAVTLAPVSSTVMVWTVPWVWLAALLVLVGLVWTVLAVRRRTARGGRHSSTGRSAGGSAGGPGGGPAGGSDGAPAGPFGQGAQPVPAAVPEPVVLRSSAG